MAVAEVFVDDAVRGDLPLVCVVTGERTDFVVREEVAVDHGLGAWWLLVFLGPIGWAVLVLVALTRRPPMLTVRLPMSDETFERLESAKRGLRIGFLLFGAGVVGSLAVIAVDLPRSALLLLTAAVAVAGVGLAVAARIALAFRQVGVSLDASGRWVTLRRVAPEFADAVRASRAQSRVV